jgi:hypothetical protein
MPRRLTLQRGESGGPGGVDGDGEGLAGEPGGGGHQQRGGDGQGDAGGSAVEILAEPVKLCGEVLGSRAWPSSRAHQVTAVNSSLGSSRAGNHRSAGLLRSSASRLLTTCRSRLGTQEHQRAVEGRRADGPC